MKRSMVVALIAVVVAGFQAMAQDMRWTTRVQEKVNQGRGGPGGGRGGGGRGMAPGMQGQEATKEKTVTVLMRMSKTSVDGKEFIAFKHAPLKDQLEEDIAAVSIPWTDKDDLTENLKTTLAEMKRPGATASERKQVYKSGDGNFSVRSIRESDNKSAEVTIKNVKGKDTVFTLPLQQVEVFYNQLRSMK